MITGKLIASFIGKFWPHILLCLISGAIVYVVTDAMWEAKYQAQRAKAEQTIAEAAKAEAAAVSRAREAEQAIATGQALVNDEAEARNEAIQSDYERRIAAGESANRRLRQLWKASVATCELSHDSAVAAAAAEQDRLRFESAERVVRDVKLAQSERDEAIDRYTKLQEAYEAMRRPAP